MIKPIRGFPNYSVDSAGIVYGKNGPLKPLKCGVGYLKVNLYKNNKLYNRRIHRLVAQEFLSGFSKKLQVNHKNGNKLDNSIQNLEMCTPRQNIAHAAKRKLHNAAKKPLLSKAEFLLICELLDKQLPTKQIAKRVGRSQRCVQYIKKSRKRKNFANKQLKALPEIGTVYGEIK